MNKYTHKKTYVKIKLPTIVNCIQFTLSDEQHHLRNKCEVKINIAISMQQRYNKADTEQCIWKEMKWKNIIWKNNLWCRDIQLRHWQTQKLYWNRVLCACLCARAPNQLTQWNCKTQCFVNISGMWHHLFNFIGKVYPIKRSDIFNWINNNTFCLYWQLSS